MASEQDSFTTISIYTADKVRFDRIRKIEDRGTNLQFKRLLDSWCETHGLDKDANPIEQPAESA